MNGRTGYVLIFVLLALLTLGGCRAAPTPTVIPPTDTPPPPTPEPTAAPQPTDASGLRVRWTYATGGAIWETATVREGAVYVGSDDHSLYALDAATGALKWQFATQGLVRSCPAVADGRVYIASDDGALYAVEAAGGKQVWRTDIGNVTPLATRQALTTNPDPLGYDYRQSSPIVAEGRVYVGSADGNVYALAADTGAVAWTYKTGGAVRATPTFDAGTIYVGSWDKAAYALDAQSGALRWQTPLGGQVQSTALAANGLVYTASRKASVWALDPASGAVRWEYGYGNNMWVESSPVLADGTLWIGSSGSEIIVGLDPATGELRSQWQTGACHWSTPLVTDDTLYIGAEVRVAAYNGLFAFQLQPGKELPPMRMLPMSEGRDICADWRGVAASPVLADGVIYVGGLDGKVYAVEG